MNLYSQLLEQCLIGSAAVLMLCCPPAALAQTHHAIDLGTLDNTPVSFGFALNSFGNCVGTTAEATANLRGFFWDGTMTSVEPLAGDLQCEAFAINDNGDVAAMSYDQAELNPHGLLWNAGTVTDLGALGPRGLNDAGTVVGYTATNTASLALVEHAGSWQSGMLLDLGTLGGNFSYAAAVNSLGQVVGWSTLAGDATVRATLWQNGVPHDLGTLGGTTSQAYAVSRESGYVAGVADTTAGSPHAMLVRVDVNGNVLSRTDLGSLGGDYSYAYGVNNAGEVVGISDSRAFYWRNGTMTDLNTLVATNSDWRLDTVSAINDSGQIVGTGVHRGQTRGFLLARIGDLDSDGHVDLSDFGSFAFCLAGPGVTTIPPSCSPLEFALSDSDGDGDTDMADYVLFQTAFQVP